MVKINKVYTKTGDDGTTGLVGGKRASKDSLRVNAYGEVDELNSHIGMVRTLAERSGDTSLVDKLTRIQHELFNIGAELATPDGDSWEGMVLVKPEQVARLEGWIDEATKELPELRSFVLPGGSEINASLHIARTVCRRAERGIITLSKREKVSSELIRYINRLSDLLFVLSRYDLKKKGVKEYLWD